MNYINSKSKRQDKSSLFLATFFRGVNGEQLAIFNEMEVHFKATSAETKQHIFNDMSQTFQAIFEETTCIRFTERWDIFETCL